MLPEVTVNADREPSFRSSAGAVADVGVGFTPLGLSADLYTLGTGRTFFGNEPVSPLMRVLGIIPGVSEAAKIGKVVKGATEVVQRAMSRAELDFLRNNGVLRFGRTDRTFVSDAVNSNANRARQRLALPRQPEVRVTVEVPAGRFSSPTTVQSLDLGGSGNLPGGGLERSTTGVVPARIIRVDEF